MKIKKNQSGMTLVEVVIALGVFSFTFLGVTMCLSAALKLNNRNMLRDRELNAQQKVIEERKVDGVAYLSGSTDKIVFGNSAIALSGNQLANGVGTRDSITYYHAVKSAAQGNTYNFEIKSLTSTPLGNATLEAADANAGIYHLHVTNHYAGNVDVVVETSGGQFFSGSIANGYKNSSTIFSRTLTPAGVTGVPGGLPSELLLGYYNPPVPPATVAPVPGTVKITVTPEGGSSVVKTIDGTTFKLTGKVLIDVNSSGGVTNPASE